MEKDRISGEISYDVMELSNEPELVGTPCLRPQDQRPSSVHGPVYHVELLTSSEETLPEEQQNPPTMFGEFRRVFLSHGPPVLKMFLHGFCGHTLR